MTTRRARRRTVAVTLAALVGGIAGFGALIDALPGRGITPPPPAGAAIAPQAAAADPAFDRLFHDGVAHLRAGRAHDAALAFDAARQRRPHVPEVYVNLGFAYLDLNAAPAATAAFEQAIAVRPTQANAYYGLAEGRARLGDRVGAASAMRAFLELSPDNDPHRQTALAALDRWRAPTDGDATSAERGDPVGIGEAPVADITVAPWLGEGGELDLAALAAGRTVVVNIWATWCAPCRAELPSLQRLSNALDPSRFAVIGISIDQDADLVREYLREVDVRYPNYVDEGGRLVTDALGVAGYPFTLVVGADGAVLRSALGARAWDDPAVIAWIGGE